MQLITIPQMKGIINHVAIKKRRPVCFHGPSGVGKSEGIAQSAQENGATLVDIRVSQYESIDFRGIPDIQQGSTVWNMPATLPFKGNPKFDEDSGKPIYLFLDEVDHGDPSVLSVLYQLLNERRVGEHVLMDNVIMLCARNRAQDKGIGNKFPDPLANRMSHFEIGVDVKSWSAWAAKAWPDMAGATIIGFLNFRPELLHTHDASKPQTVFATPRAWSFAYQDFSDTTMPEDLRIASITGSVGEGPGIELTAFAKIMDSLPDINTIIANPKTAPVHHELDLQWALASHVAGHMTEDNADPLHEYLSRLEPEMVVMAWTMAINRNEAITNTNAFLFGYAPQYRGLFQN